MKIDTNTVNVLKNFAKINPSIIVNEGNVLKTISPNKTIMARAKVKTDFNRKFAIYNLSRFISIISTFNEPEFEFGEKSVDISDDNKKIHYVYADEITVKVSERELNLPEFDIKFRLTQQDMENVEKAAGILGLPEIHVSGDGNNLYLQARDIKNPTGDVYSIAVGTTDKEFCAVFKVENIKILPGDYTVSISSNGLSHFVKEDIEYFIAVETTSVF